MSSAGVLRHDLRLELALAISWEKQRNRADLRQHRLHRGPVPVVAAAAADPVVERCRAGAAIAVDRVCPGIQPSPAREPHRPRRGRIYVQSPLHRVRSGAPRTRNYAASLASADIPFITDAHVRVSPGWDDVIDQRVSADRILAGTVSEANTPLKLRSRDLLHTTNPLLAQPTWPNSTGC
jgi:hypothetical protein